jgi:GTPase SAR1 family protein
MALEFTGTYKILVLGDSNVGKTCIVHRYCDERYYDTYISTIGEHPERALNALSLMHPSHPLSTGIDFKQKIINLDGTPVKLQIW